MELEPHRQGFTVAPPAPVEPATMETLRKVLDSATVTLVCHPDDAPRIRAAVEDLADAPPIRVITFDAMPPGKVATWTGELDLGVDRPLHLGLVQP